MLIKLILVGLFVGMLSGFFGIGGGMILVPMLMLIGFNIKAAIGISVVQMVFSSVSGSYRNYKQGVLEVNEGLWVGIGGIFGGIIGARFTDLLPKEILQYIFLALVIFAFLQIATTKKLHSKQEKASFNKFILFIIGLVIGIVAMMLGVGGSIMLTPVLIGFLHFSSKKAATAGLFFVVFSSVSGFVYKILTRTFENLSLDWFMVLSLAFAASIGAILGLKLKDIVYDSNHKRYLLIMYIVIIVMLVYKTFIKG